MWLENAQFYNECKCTDPSLRFYIVSIRKVHLTHTGTEASYGHKPHNFTTNVNQGILAYV